MSSATTINSTVGTDMFPLTDTGNAERFVERFGNVVRYCWPWKKWFAWNGRRWRIDDNGSIDHFAKLTGAQSYRKPQMSPRRNGEMLL